MYYGTDARGRRFADYRIGFPKELTGTPYTLLLQGSAVLNFPHSLGELVAEETSACGLTSGSTCQTIAGVVPAKGEQEGWCRPLRDAKNRVVVSIAGDMAQQPESVDWAHDLYVRPGLVTRDHVERSPDWKGGALPGTPYRLAQAACYWEHYPGVVTEAYVSPTAVSQGQHYWFGPVASVPNFIVVKSRNANSFANMSIAFGGVLAAIAVGLMPHATALHRRWRSGRFTARTPAN